MKKKVLSMLMAAMMVSNCGIIAFAEEVEEVVVETSAEEAAPAEETVEEEAIEDEAVEDAIDVEDEVEIVDEEVALAGPEAEVEIEVESNEDTEVDEEITIEDEEVALAAIEEEHEHHFAYRSNGDQTHTKFCTDCDDEKEIINCVDDDEDGVCDICSGAMDVQVASGLTIEVNHWTETVISVDGDNFAVNDIGDFVSETSFMSSSDRLNFDLLITAANDQENEDYCFYTNNINYSSFSDLEGIEDVYTELSGEIPSNASIVIYEKDGVIEDYTIEMNDNYDPNKSCEIVEEETIIKDEETPLAGNQDADSEDEDVDDEDVDTTESDDAIKPEDMEVVDTEDVEAKVEEIVEEVITEVEDIVIETPSEAVTVEETVEESVEE